MIRTITQEDSNEIKELFQTHVGFWHESWTDQTLLQAIKSSNDLAFAYIQDQLIVGCIFGYDLGFRGYTGGLFVREDLRRQKIAQSLLGRVQSILQERKCRSFDT